MKQLACETPLLHACCRLLLDVRSLGLSLLLLAGCGLSGPVPDRFPDADIVFQVTTLLLGEDEGRVGFVRADGTEVSYLDLGKVAFRGGSHALRAEMGPLVLPVWTSDGSTLVFRGLHAPLYRGPLLAVRAGESAVVCPVEPGAERPSLAADQEHMVIDLVGSGWRLGLYSLSNCLRSEGGQALTLYPISPERNPGYGALSPRGDTLAYVGVDPGPPREQAVILRDVSTGLEKVVAHGSSPTWSANGGWLAYRGADGIHVVEADGSDDRRVVEYVSPEEGMSYENWPPLPSWSPDGKWIVYHKCTLPTDPKTHCDLVQDYSIFKVNVETGKEVKILDGGLNPYWRWRTSK